MVYKKGKTSQYRPSKKKSKTSTAFPISDGRKKPKTLSKIFPDLEYISDEISVVYYQKKPNMELIQSKVDHLPIVVCLEKLPPDFEAKWRVGFFPISWVPDFEKIKNTEFYELYLMGNDQTNRPLTEQELKRTREILEEINKRESKKRKTDGTDTEPHLDERNLLKILNAYERHEEWSAGPEIMQFLEEFYTVIQNNELDPPTQSSRNIVEGWKDWNKDDFLAWLYTTSDRDLIMQFESIRNAMHSRGFLLEWFTNSEIIKEKLAKISR